MTEIDLENFYREHIEEDIIFMLSEIKTITTIEAMDIYYQSNLANKIYSGEYGVQYLDPSVLVELLEKEININV